MNYFRPEESPVEKERERSKVPLLSLRHLTAKVRGLFFRPRRGSIAAREKKRLPPGKVQYS